MFEQPALRSLMPELGGRSVVDLGCGTGQIARWAVERGATSVQAHDASERTVAEATAQPTNAKLVFRNARIETVDHSPGSVDVVVSGPALHYVADFRSVAARVWRWLRTRGSFVFSVEHPVTTYSSRRWHDDASGRRLHWAVDRYAEEGSRIVHWLGVDTAREHRTVATYVNTLLDQGFVLKRLLEPVPTLEEVERWPKLADNRRRPAFLSPQGGSRRSLADPAGRRARRRNPTLPVSSMPLPASS